VETPAAASAAEGEAAAQVAKPAEPQAPETTPEQTAVIVDLHWLIHQGAVLEFADGRMETAKKPAPKPPKPEKKPAVEKPAPESETAAAIETATPVHVAVAPVPEKPAPVETAAAAVETPAPAEVATPAAVPAVESAGETDKPAA